MVIAASVFGRRTFSEPPEMAEARALLSRRAGNHISPPATV